MPFTVTMPKLSPTMSEGTIAKWHKKEGDEVEPGELLLEIATDKATVEYNALDGGWLRKILVKEGKEAEINDPIAIFTEEKGESIEGYKPKMPTKDEEEVEKASKEETPEEESEKPKEVKEAQKLKQAAFAPEPPLTSYEFRTIEQEIDKRIKASPLAKKIAKERSLDLTTVKGSGPGGRILQEDLDAAQKLSAASFGRREIPEIVPGTYEEESLTPVRKAIVKRVQEAKTFIPHFYVRQTVDAKPLFQCREQFSSMDIKVSFNDFVTRACALALREHPSVNSGFDSTKNAIIKFKTIDISIAVEVSEGLITPIIRHADYKNLGQLSYESRTLAKRARAGELEMHEYKGGSFTVSNLGMFGVTDFSAILNPPQSAILAVSAIEDAPVVKNGEIIAGKTMNITLSCDHRVIDGVHAAKFVKTVQKFLENPAVLLI